MKEEDEGIYDRQALKKKFLDALDLDEVDYHQHAYLTLNTLHETLTFIMKPIVTIQNEEVGRLKAFIQDQ